MITSEGVVLHLTQNVYAPTVQCFVLGCVHAQVL